MKTGKRLFSERFTLQTILSANEVISRINKGILPRDAWKRRKEFPDMNRPYQGSTGVNSFEISKIAGYRKEIFHPLISGNLYPEGNKTTIYVRMRPFVMVRFVFFAWLVFMGLTCLAIIYLLVFRTGRIDFNINSLYLAAPFLAFILVWFMALGEFKSECRKSKQFLTTLLDASEIT